MATAPAHDVEAKSPSALSISTSTAHHEPDGRLRRLLRDDADLRLWLQHTRYFDVAHRQRILDGMRKLQAIDQEREKVIVELQGATGELVRIPPPPPPPPPPQQQQQQQVTSLSGSASDSANAGSSAGDEEVVPASVPAKGSAAIVFSLPRPAKIKADTRFFLVKCFNTANIYMSQRDGLWVTQNKNGEVFEQAFRECQSVILFFSINKSRGFQGFARMLSAPDPALPKPDWIQRINLKAATDPFRVEWINTAVTEFDQVGDLKNPLNEFRSVVVGRDGQEYPPECGLKMMALLSQTAIKPSYSAVVVAAPLPKQPPTGRSSTSAFPPAAHPQADSSSSTTAIQPPPSSRPWRAIRHRELSPSRTPLPPPSTTSVPELSSQRSHPNLIDC
ncbi:hypothetical protein CDD80_1067 [Ophiocordyceps camponoti-rufipedis]|uniref:YTH domain-containing protein n=1 Tax=Ophiocordyceps camponoti-rufipedis TaxID=2004952 RepID=A0A2C5ZF40_9HYPO|nr:hypothetical protein CDD80_1067 [Ophiocordyceps camponoti-rufipedis]